MCGVEEREDGGRRGGGEAARDGEERSCMSAERKSENCHVGVSGWVGGFGHGASNEEEDLKREERVCWRINREERAKEKRECGRK